MIEIDILKTIVALSCLGACIYALHRGWSTAAGWFGIFTFFAVLGLIDV